MGGSLPPVPVSLVRLAESRTCWFEFYLFVSFALPLEVNQQYSAWVSKSSSLFQRNLSSRPNCPRRGASVQQAELWLHGPGLTSTCLAGSWSIQMERGNALVVLRSLLWPGLTFYHAPRTKNYGYIYVGTGEKNLDLPFML